DREVGESVGHSLVADLYDADSRNEHSEEPKPADCQEWSPGKLPKTDDRNDQQQEAGGNHLPDRPRARVRIKDRQVAWPYNLSEVPRIRDQRVGNALGQRELLAGDEQIQLFVTHDSDEGGGGGKNE